MDKKVIKEIVENCGDKSNKVLMETQIFLHDEFNKTKELIINLTRHLETVEKFHNKIGDEIKKRKI